MDFFRSKIQLLIFCIGWWLPANSSDLALLRSDAGDFCVTNSSSAIYYTLEDGSIKEETKRTFESFYSCGFEDNEECTDDFKENPRWKKVNSLEYDNIPVFDQSWEDLPVRILNYTKKSSLNSSSFERMLKLNNSENFSVTLSLRSTEAQFFFCDEENVLTASCYCFILQGSNRFCILKKSSNEQIPINDEDFVDVQCRYLSPSERGEPWIEMNKWKHIILEKQGQFIYLKNIVNAVTRIIFHYEDTGKSIKVQFMLGNSYKVTYCKIHKYNYLRTTDATNDTIDITFERFGMRDRVTYNAISFSISLTTCEKCWSKIIGRLPGSEDIIAERLLPPSYKYWKEHKIFFTNVPSNYVYIGFQTFTESSDSDSFWSIDNLRYCSSEEYRVSVKQNQKIKKCVLLSKPKELEWQDSNIVPNNNCDSLNQLSGLCIPCDVLQENGIVKSCKKIRICEEINNEKGCFCSPGYTGSNCSTACKEGTFGYGCLEECGNCWKNEPCTIENGTCHCRPAFKGTLCKIPKFGSILKKPPFLFATTNSCAIQLLDTELMGEERIDYFLVQYQTPATYESRNITYGAYGWADYGKIEKIHGSGVIRVENLESDTTYFLRILVARYEYLIKALESAKIPFTVCKTTCIAWTAEDIVIKQDNGSVHFNIAISKDKCKVTSYKWIISKLDGTEQLSNGSARLSFQVEDLPVFTSLKICFSGLIRICKEFRTAEAAPEPPSDVRHNLSKGNTLELYWKNPKNINGDLKNFELTITIGNHSDTFIQENGTEFIKEGYKMFYHVQFPVPPARDLKVEISAITTMRGKPSLISVSSYPAKPFLMNPHISITNTTVSTISVYLDTTLKDLQKDRSTHYLLILISDPLAERENQNVKNLENLVNETIQKVTKLCIVAEYDLNGAKLTDLNFTIGRDTENESFLLNESNIINEPLKEGQFYNITILLVNQYKNKFRTNQYNIWNSTQVNPHSSDYGVDGYFLLYLLVFLVPIFVGMVIFHKKIFAAMAKNISENIPDDVIQGLSQSRSNDEGVALNSRRSNAVTSSEKRVNNDQSKLGDIPSNSCSNNKIHSEAVKLANFERYVKTSIMTGELEKQFELLSPKDMEYSECQSSTVNETSNIYLDLVAYDRARVKLERSPREKQCPYINASLIDGYKMPRAYIASQNPKIENFKTYWRMVWQEKVKYVFMLSNIYGGENKVDRFWPNSEEELSFGDMSVKVSHATVSADLECRTLKLTRKKEEREIVKILFTSWPTNDVPFHPQCLIPLVTEIVKTPLSSSSPILVQCSDGVGETGTILLIDISLRMANEKGTVDLLHNLQELRNQKLNLVVNVEQYKLAHLVVLQLLSGRQTSIRCSDLNEMGISIIDTEEYKTQMEYLRNTEWQNQAMHKIQIYTEILDNYPEKNRIQSIVPEDFGKVVLEKYPEDDLSSSYINAVQVDGYKCRGRYIVTQQPMPNTLGDFWRFIVEKCINIIISLNEIDMGDETCCEFLPTVNNSVLQPVDFILVTYKEEIIMQSYNILHLHVENWKKREKMDVEVLLFKNWPAKNLLPSSCDEFFSFWEEADTRAKKSKHIAVTCYDGVTASGVYVALSFIIEKMKAEHKCDVCQAVQIVRHNRKQFVTEEKQFVFLFVAAIRFVNGFQFYSNFQNK